MSFGVLTDWIIMQVSLDMLLEQACLSTPFPYQVLCRKDGRPIERIEPLWSTQNYDERTLYVASSRDVEDVIPPQVDHLILSGADELRLNTLQLKSLAVVAAKDAQELYITLLRSMTSISAWDTRLLEAIAARQEMDSLLHLASEMLHNPIALFDDRLALLGWAGDMPPESATTIWADVLLAGYSPAEFYTRDELRLIERNLPLATWPLVITPGRTPVHQNLTRAIRIGERVVGSIGQVDVNGPFTPGQVAFADLVCDRLQLAFQQRLVGGPHEDGAAHLVRMALNAGRVDEGLLSYHLSKLGWDASKGFRLLCCPLSTNSQAIAKSIEARLAKAHPRAVTLRYENEVVSLVPAADKTPKPYLETISKLQLTCTQSEPFDHLADIHRAHAQCTLILRGIDEGTGSPANLAQTFEALLPRLLAREYDADTLCAHEICRLMNEGYQGNRTRGSELVHELYVYLVNGCNANLTARQLFLHRNTFAYHVEQLEDVLGERFSDMSRSRRLHLLVSCLLQGIHR